MMRALVAPVGIVPPLGGVEGMQTVRPRRLIAVSAAILFPDLGLAAVILRRTPLKNVNEDSAEMERLVTANGLDWTIAHPPRLANGGAIDDDARIDDLDRGRALGQFRGSDERASAGISPGYCTIQSSW